MIYIDYPLRSDPVSVVCFSELLKKVTPFFMEIVAYKIRSMSKGGHFFLLVINQSRISALSFSSIILGNVLFGYS
jgi:hypothetical protein